MDFGIIEDLLKDDQTVPTDIKVVGVGGGGGNAVNRMIEAGLKKVTFVALNTDVQALQRSSAQIRNPIGKQLTGGLGAGGNPERGEQAALESKEEIKQLLEGTDMVFITAGMGGGTGTGAAPVVAEVAKGLGVLTVGVVTTPFAFEGKKKLKFALDGIEKLRKNVDTLIIIPNQHLLSVAQNNTPIKQAFLMADDVLRQGVQGVTELITEPGEINIDFADVCNVMKDKGEALMGIGIGEGEDRARKAAKEAISNPLLENATINGAKSVLVNICGGEDLTLQEYQEVVELVTKNCDEDALIIAGQAYNSELGGQLKVTVVATGFVSKPTDEMMVSTNVVPEVKPQTVAQQFAAQPQPAQPAAQVAQQPQQTQPQPENVINVARWQEFQRQVNNRPINDRNDRSIPTVLRYGNNNDNKYGN